MELCFSIGNGAFCHAEVGNFGNRLQQAAVCGKRRRDRACRSSALGSVLLRGNQ